MAKKEILDKVDLALEATFKLLELKMKGLAWAAKLKVELRLPEVHQNYQVTLFLNEDPFERRIEGLEKQSMEDTLFKSEKEWKKRITKEISEVKDELEAKKAECPDIEFAVALMELKYVTGGSQIVVTIPTESIEIINAKKHELGDYKIRLEPMSV